MMPVSRTSRATRWSWASRFKATRPVTLAAITTIGLVVCLAAERKKLPDQFGERALDIGAVVEEADADARGSGLRPVKPAPHDLARHGEVRDIAGSRRWNRRPGLLQQQA